MIRLNDEFKEEKGIITQIIEFRFLIVFVCLLACLLFHFCLSCCVCVSSSPPPLSLQLLPLRSWAHVQIYYVSNSIQKKKSKKKLWAITPEKTHNTKCNKRNQMTKYRMKGRMKIGWEWFGSGAFSSFYCFYLWKSKI